MTYAEVSRTLFIFNKRCQPTAALEPDFNPEPASVRLYRCSYSSRCRAPRCPALTTTVILRKLDAAGGRFGKMELSDTHRSFVFECERTRDT